MTATIQVSDVTKLLEVTDRRFTTRAGDDPAPPEYIAVLAQAVQQHIATLAPAAGGGEIDTAEVDRLRAELAEVKRQRDTHARALERQAAPFEALKKALAKTDGEIAKLKSDLAAAEQSAATWEAEYERVRDEKLTELTDALAERDAARLALEEKAAATAEEHRHTYEWTDPKAAPLPCSCGQPYPRGAIRRATGKPPTPEPFADLFANIRAQLSGEPGWSA